MKTIIVSVLLCVCLSIMPQSINKNSTNIIYNIDTLILVDTIYMPPYKPLTEAVYKVAHAINAAISQKPK